MNKTKKIFIGLSAFFLSLLVVGFLLPNHWKAEESLVINAKKEDIYEQIANLKNWQKWSAWSNKTDPNATYTYEGPEEGLFSKQIWNGPKVGKGELTIVKASVEDGIEYDLSMEKPSPMTCHGNISFIKIDENQTKVVWVDQGDLGNNPLKRYMGFLIGKMVAKDFKLGLNNIKTLLEKQNN